MAVAGHSGGRAVVPQTVTVLTVLSPQAALCSLVARALEGTRAPTCVPTTLPCAVRRLKRLKLCCAVVSTHFSPLVPHPRHRGMQQQPLDCSRRALIAATLAAGPLRSQAARAAPPPLSASPLRVVVSLGPGVAALPPPAALYVTARPAGRGAQPVAAARVVVPEGGWPADVELSAEGAAPDAVVCGALVVSARLDADGVAATRDADDLVGRAAVDLCEARLPAVTLAGRGFGGRLVTQRR